MFFFARLRLCYEFYVNLQGKTTWIITQSVYLIKQWTC